MTRDHAAALRWHRRAAERGHPGAIYNLGVAVLDNVTIAGNEAGTGGIGGDSTGLDGADATLPLQSGADGGSKP